MNQGDKVWCTHHDEPVTIFDLNEGCPVSTIGCQFEDGRTQYIPSCYLKPIGINGNKYAKEIEDTGQLSEKSYHDYKNKPNQLNMNQIVMLSNGKRVANFSSPHDFNYTDGTILPRVSDQQSKLLEVTFSEYVENERGDISLSFTLSPQVLAHMDYWRSLYFHAEVDVVICALPMLIAIATLKGNDWLYNSPFRGIRAEDRITKLASIDKQCLAKGQI